MREIVFDDLNTPCFRLRNGAAEDNTLAERSLQPMTIMHQPMEDEQDRI